ncbi:MAG TPA: response regulator [Anaerolineae bacterium]|nr:response regulator [Anaerolineae bacterium]
MTEPMAQFKILCVDDDAVIRGVMSLILERQGFQVRTAHNGPAGIKTALDWLPDLILMDLMMPVMDGFEATAALRADPRTVHIPVVAFTTMNETNMQAKIQAAGMDGMVPKLSPPRILVSTLRTYLPPLAE